MVMKLVSVDLTLGAARPGARAVGAAGVASRDSEYGGDGRAGRSDRGPSGAAAGAITVTGGPRLSAAAPGPASLRGASPPADGRGRRPTMAVKFRFLWQLSSSRSAHND
jgi:hypothetical protein